MGILFDEIDLVGKVISKVEVGGYGIDLITEDGLKLDFNAADGGYSIWEISKEEVGCEDKHVNNLINKDDLSNEIQRIYDEHYSESTSQTIHDIFNAVFKRINKAKVVDAEPVRHGHWIKNDIFSDDWNTTSNCSVCGGCVSWFSVPLNYCPDCGAKMDEKEI